MRLNSPKRFYWLFALACLAGYLWLGVGIIAEQSHREVEVCLVKHATDLPCPSCGSTRSVMSVFRGDFQQALMHNPFGLIILVVIVVGPIWLLADGISKRKSLYQFFKRTEHFFQRKWVAIPAILLVLANWIWNITKNT